MSAQERTTMEPSTFDRIWRGSGIAFVVTFVVSWFVYGSQPDIGASAATLASFYEGDRTRILLGSSLLALALLNLLWFAAALASRLRDAGQGIWAAAATAASTAVATIIYVRIFIGAALAYSIAGSGNDAVTAGLNDLSRVLLVVAAFPTAMLIMAGSFGLWRAGIISNAWFAASVVVVILGVLRGTTWASDGFWAPDGTYSCVITPLIALVWVALVSGLITARGRSRVGATSRASVPAM